jgi:formylglycine-generating enzyme required for sulfatase activity
MILGCVSLLAGEPNPTSNKTYPVKDAGREIDVPEGMVFVPAGKLATGDGATAKETPVEAFCIGRFEVTNAEWKRFLDATGGRPPRYWKGGTFPTGKAKHPVLFVSLTEAQQYGEWVSKATGWRIVIPSADQWEWAARGPKGGRYPWGDEKGASYEGGKLKARFNYNGVCAAHFLGKPDTMTSYGERSTRKGEPVAVRDISADGRPLGISRDGGVTGWIDHSNHTGFVGTTLYQQLVAEGGFTTPAGSYEDGKSWCGAYDMAGNAYEWTTTLITATNGAERGKQVNEIRGGSWYSTSRSCVSTSTGEGRAASGSYHSVGFRVAMLLPAEHP